jgi:hypothetical protein
MFDSNREELVGSNVVFMIENPIINLASFRSIVKEKVLVCVDSTMVVYSYEITPP